MSSLRDRLGHFLPGQARPAEPAADVADQAEAVEDVLQEQPADLYARLAELRAQRQQLLAAGDVAAVIILDAEVARLQVAFESAGARADALHAAAAERERTHLVDLWRRVHGPRVEAARTRRDAAALEIWHAIDDCAAVEVEAEGIANMLGFRVEITPTESVITRYMLENWIAAHVQRQRAA